MNADHIGRAGPRLARLLALVLSGAAGTASAQSVGDTSLRQALVALSSAEEIDETLAILDRTVRAEPRMGTAHMLSADLFALMGGVRPPQDLAGPPAPEGATPRETRLRPPSNLGELRADLRARSAHVMRPADHLPLNVLALGQGIDHVLLIDVSAPRVFVLGRRGTGLSVEAEYYTSVGLLGGGKQQEGDMRTPLGTYRIRAELPARKLQRYHGAFAWALNYPNADDRAAGRTGRDIWIHGMPPNTLTRPPNSTEGCVAMSNEDLLALRRRIRFDRTLVVLVDDVVWAPRGRWQAARQQSLAAARRQVAEERLAHPRDALAPADRSSLVALRPRVEVLMVRDMDTRTSALPIAATPASLAVR